MIDFEAARPRDVRTDSRARGWLGFRVVRRLDQAPAELSLDPSEPAPAPAPDAVAAGSFLRQAATVDRPAVQAVDGCHDDLVCLNRGLDGR